MEIAFSGDIHANEFSDFAKDRCVTWDGWYFVDDEQGTVTNSRLIDCLDCLVQIRDTCIERKIYTFCIAGDLFHTRGKVSTIVYNNTYRVLESFKNSGIRVIILAGNHDQNDNTDEPENSIFALKGVADVISTNTLKCFTDTNHDIELFCVPFSKNKSKIVDYLSQVVDTKPQSELTCRILMAHVGVWGALVGKNNYAMKDMFTVDDLCYDMFKYVMLAHYHKPQYIRDNTIYVGSPLQHNFNDEGEDRGFWIINTERRYHMEFLPLKSPKFITVTDHKKLKNIDTSYDFIKVEVSPEDVSKLKLSEDTPVRIEVKKEFTPESRSDMSISMSYPEMIEEYAKTKCDEDCSELIAIGRSIIESVMSEGSGD